MGRYMKLLRAVCDANVNDIDLTLPSYENEWCNGFNEMRAPGRIHFEDDVYSASTLAQNVDKMWARQALLSLCLSSFAFVLRNLCAVALAWHCWRQFIVVLIGGVKMAGAADGNRLVPTSVRTDSRDTRI